MPPQGFVHGRLDAQVVSAEHGQFSKDVVCQGPVEGSQFTLQDHHMKFLDSMFQFVDKQNSLADVAAKYVELGRMPTHDMHAIPKVMLDESMVEADSNMKQHVAQTKSELQTALDDEAARAKAVEQTLTTNLEAEKVRAQTAEQLNSDAISNLSEQTVAQLAAVQKSLADEAKTRENKDVQIHSQIENSVKMLMAADAKITVAVESESQRAKDAEAALHATLDEEVTNRTNAVQNVSDKVQEETERAKAAEQANAQAIKTEQQRAEKEEASLRRDLTQEVDRANAAELRLSQSISQESLSRAQELAKERSDRDAAIAEAVSNLVGGASEALDTLKELADAMNNDADLHTNLVALIESRHNEQEKMLGAHDSRIKAEIARATAAEQGLDVKLDAEVANRTSAVAQLHEKVDTESARAKTAEGVIIEKIDSEIARASAVEQRLQKELDQEEARGMRAEAHLQSQITLEINARDSGDKHLQEQLNQEISRATARDNENATAIASLGVFVEAKATEILEHVETSDKKHTENFRKVEESLALESAQRKNADIGLQSAINSESDRAQSRENAIDARITTEVDRSTTEDARLRAALNTEVARAQQAEDQLSKAISAEASRAKAEENRLDQNLSSESSARKALGVRLDSAIQTETARATAEEEALRSQIQQESFARARAISQEQQNRDQAIDAAIHNITGGASEHLDTLREIGAHFAAADQSLEASMVSQFTAQGDKIAALEAGKFDKSGGELSGPVTAPKMTAPLMFANELFIGSRWKIAPSSDPEQNTLGFWYNTGSMEEPMWVQQATVSHTTDPVPSSGSDSGSGSGSGSDSGSGSGSGSGSA